MTDTEGMLLALEQAQEAARKGETPVGAVLVKNGKILARAYNLRETRHDPTAHAEMLCIRQAAEALGDWRLQDCTLYVTLEPCPMCAGAMVMSRLSRCVYGASDPAVGCCGSVYDLPADPAFHARTRWQSGVLEDACAQQLSSFFESRREKEP